MSTGPEEARLRAVLATADAGVVDTAALEWGAGAQLLELVAGALENAAPAIGSQFGQQTGHAAQLAFRRASTKVRGRARLMGEASTALGSAHAALVHAERVRDSLGAPLSEPQRPAPTPGPSTPDDVAAQRAYDSARAGYDAAFSKRESDSAAATAQMDTVYTASTETMKKVHGEPDPAPRTSGGDGSGGGSTGTSTSPVAASPDGRHRSPTGGHPTYTTTTSPTSGPTTSGTPAHTVPGGPAGGSHAPSSSGTSAPGGPGQQSGTAQGGNDAYPSGPPPGVPVAPGVSATGPGSPTGLAAPTAGGLAGALGGGALGGLTGISGAVRGPSPVPPGSAAGAAGAAGRPIGGTARTGATGGTLGRSGAATTSGGTSASRGAGSRDGAGRGTAGSRGAPGARGSAAGGQGGRKNKDPRKKNTDFFEEEQDWVEDEGAAPAVID